MEKTQSLKSKKGEVNFRKKLTLQFAGKDKIAPRHPTKKEHLKLLKERIHDTRNIFRDLEKRGISLSPYLEIGAEVGHRSMLLENEFNATGFASDISLESLKSGKNFLKPLGFNKLPKRICCDAYNLPFPTNSIPFVFCFQTLHHFPDPKPILKEVKRVLTPGGYFYFSEEPVAQLVNLNIWRRDFHLTWFEKILKKLIILHFISRIGKGEVDHDILEETFDLKTWEKALNIFPKAEVTLGAFPLGPTSIQIKTKNPEWINPPFHKRIVLEIMGGGITALCQKEKGEKQKITNNLLNLLSCPNCKHKPRLKPKQKNTSLICTNCNSQFKKTNGVYMLLSKKTEKALYQ